MTSQSDAERLNIELFLAGGRFSNLASFVMQGDESTAMLVARAASDEDARHIATILNHDLDQVQVLSDRLGRAERTADELRQTAINAQTALFEMRAERDSLRQRVAELEVAVRALVVAREAADRANNLDSAHRADEAEDDAYFALRAVLTGDHGEEAVP